MKKVTIVLMLVILLLAVGLIWLNYNNEDDSVNAPIQPYSTNQISETSEPSENTEQQEIEEIPLTSVGNYSGDGTATRTITGEYIHTVTANIGNPAEGKFYEGWIVGGPDEFISTGKLTQETEGVWTLVFTSPSDKSAYTQVVITEETEANGLDNNPEDHVLEGSF